jgi:hypothetical protein
MCGSHALTSDTRSQLALQGYAFDDTGDNISHDNTWLGDLTGLYWVWRNTDHEWVGTNQYRRFYDDEHMAQQQLNDRTIWVSNYVWFPFSISQQYRQCHGDIGLHILWEAARQGRIDISTSMIEDLDRIDILSPCNMFFGHRRWFDRICSILFDVVLELRQGVRYSLPYIQVDPVGKNQTRMLAFLAERILNIIYFHHRHFLGDVDITPVRYHTHGDR